MKELRHGPLAFGFLVVDLGLQTHHILVPILDLLARYEAGVMQALKKPAKVGGHVNALQRIGGFMKAELSGPKGDHIQEIIEAYRQGIVPLITPLTLLKHHLRSTDMGWLLGQVYLSPYPEELALRSRI